LIETFPGIERLEQADGQGYALSLHIKQAPLMGVYGGQVSITEYQSPYFCRIAISSEGRQNTLKGSGVIHLSRNEDNTVLVYNGMLEFGRLGTRLPSLVARGAAKMLLQQFFSALADQVRANRNARGAEWVEQAVKTEELAGAGVSVIRQAGGNIVILPPPPLAQQVESSSISQTLVRWFGLGAGDYEQEVLWARRLRQAGMLSVLLLLVWVGTRIPRRWMR